MLTASCGLAPDSYELDNQCSSAKPILVDEQQAHSLHSRYDKDWLRLRVEAGRRYRVRIARNFVNDSRLVIELQESCTGFSSDRGSFLFYTATASGYVYLKVSGQKRTRYEIVATEIR
jgi:hypothetical protein